MGQAERGEVVVGWKSCTPDASARRQARVHTGVMTLGKGRETSPERVLYGQSTVSVRVLLEKPS
jgi:hypothetical protein